MPEITVIVPVYNIAPYLPKCIDSLTRQTFEDFEVILVNDGSSDDSPEICRRIALQDARFRVIEQTNGGASKARNEGISSARGHYISFVDGDDYVSEIFLEQLYRSIVDNHAEISICGIQCVDTACHPIPSPFSNNQVPEKVSPREAVGWLGRNLVFGVVWNKLYRKELFDLVRFTNGRTFEDELILHHIYDQCGTIATVNQKLYYYVQRSDSKMHESFSISKMDVIFAYIDRMVFLLDNNYSSDVIMRNHDKLIWSFFYAYYYKRTDKESKKLSEYHRMYINKVYKKLSPKMRTPQTALFAKAPLAAFYLFALKNKIKNLFNGLSFQSNGEKNENSTHKKRRAERVVRSII